MLYDQNLKTAWTGYNRIKPTIENVRSSSWLEMEMAISILVKINAVSFYPITVKWPFPSLTNLNYVHFRW
jgi:hypothetical protein